MSPESIESRFAGLQAEVRSWETQMRSLSPLVGQYQVLEDRIARASRDIEQVRQDIAQRFHDVNTEQDRRLKREVEALRETIMSISQRRDSEIRDVQKRIGDVSLTLKADIDECRSEAVALLGDRTSRRGQNLALLATIVTGLLVILNGILIQSM